MTEPVPAPAPPATVQMVAVKVAEQIMSDVYRRIAELEARLELVEREASEADQLAEMAQAQGPAFVEIAQQLLRQAEGLRTSARALADGAHEPGRIDDPPVVRLATAPAEPPQDEPVL